MLASFIWLITQGEFNFARLHGLAVNKIVSGRVHQKSSVPDHTQGNDGTDQQESDHGPVTNAPPKAISHFPGRARYQARLWAV